MKFIISINCIATGYNRFQNEWWAIDERAQVNSHIPMVEAIDREDAVSSVVDFLYERYRKRLALNEKIEKNDSSVVIFNRCPDEEEFTIYSVSACAKGDPDEKPV